MIIYHDIYSYAPSIVVQVGFENSQYMIPEGNGSVEICLKTSIKVDFEFEVFAIAIPHSAACKLTKFNYTF